jgi:hypothetical protein
MVVECCFRSGKSGFFANITNGFSVDFGGIVLAGYGF